MDLVEFSKRSAVASMEDFLRNFSYIPDEKLDWRPAPTAKSGMRIAAHTALFAVRFAKMIRERELPGQDGIDAWVARCVEEEIDLTDRGEMERVFRAGTAEVLSALDGLRAEDIELTLGSESGFSVPMRHVMGLPSFHATVHMGQIDFLQTCWDDQEVYF